MKNELGDCVLHCDDEDLNYLRNPNELISIMSVLYSLVIS